MAIKRVVLHVGQPKTGTTSIQDSLAQNQNLLANRGFHYPCPLYGNQYHGFALQTIVMNPEEIAASEEYVQAGLDGTVAGAIDYKTLTENTFSKIITERMKWCDTLLIVGEHIYNFTMQQLEWLKNYFFNFFGIGIDFSIFIYVRDPLTAVIAYAQTAAIYHGLTAESLRESVVSFSHASDPRRIANFQAVFGNESVCVSRFEDCLLSNGPVEHFLLTLGFSHRGIMLFEIVRKNESQCQFLFDLLCYFNKKIPILLNNQTNPMRGNYNFHHLLGLKGRKADLPLSDKISLARTFANSYELLGNNFGINYPESVSLMQQDGTNVGRVVQWDKESIVDLSSKCHLLSSPSKQLLSEFLSQYSLCHDISSVISEMELTPPIDKMFEAASLESCAHRPHLDTSGSICNDYAQILWDHGKGFSAENSRRFPMSKNQRCIAIDMEFSKKENVRCCRFDPSSLSSQVIIDELLVNGCSDNYMLSPCNHPNYWRAVGNFYCFLEDKPKILIVPRARGPIKSIRIHFRVEYNYALIDSIKAQAVIDTLKWKSTKMEAELHAIRALLKRDSNNIQSDYITQNIERSTLPSPIAPCPITADENGIPLRTVYYIDEPSNAQELFQSEELRVAGWCLDGVGVAEVSVLIDDRRFCPCTLGAYRPDVFIAHPRYQTNHSGFHANLVLKSVPPGLHEVVIRITDNKGDTVITPAKRILIRE